MKAKLVKESLLPLHINEYDTSDTNILKGKKEIPVRFYDWSDPNMGWGDGGTKFYATLPVEAFEVKENNRDDGSKWYGFELKREWKQKVGITSGFDGGWHFDIGDKKRKEEEKEAAMMIALTKKVKKF